MLGGKTDLVLTQCFENLPDLCKIALLGLRLMEPVYALA